MTLPARSFRYSVVLTRVGIVLLLQAAAAGVIFGGTYLADVTGDYKGLALLGPFLILAAMCQIPLTVGVFGKAIVSSVRRRTDEALGWWLGIAAIAGLAGTAFVVPAW